MTAEQPSVIAGTLVLAERVGPGAVVVRDGLVEEVVHGSRRVADLQWPGFIAPGLVDIHVHGARGRSFNEPDSRAWHSVTEAHREHGTTTTLATLGTSALPQLREAIAIGTAELATGHGGLAGLHLEGPYLADGYRGAHPPDLLRQPTDGHWREFTDHGTVRMVTLAPELAGAKEAITGLSGRGVVVSAGHSAANADQVREAVAHGVRHAAHLWSGHTELRRHGPVREPGLLEAVLGSEELTAELIADGHHVTADMTRVAYRCLGPDRLCLVSDASPGTGLPTGARFGMGAIEGTVAQGVAISRDGRSFCGSVSFLADVLRFAVRQAAVPLVDAVRMATATPARAAGLADGVGRLKAGGRADLLLLDRALKVGAVLAAGRWVRPPAHAQARS
ncbi:N-acetylglucosamine-6-phosphate deacetylase [Kitasatospora viridis]|uniref:N-acetylglucosamine-6-phosphate deacetylase n=1 Tax=Kitasatospora viridis TaxID=281105 RepID=UPI0014792AD4|nr:amidohydrolase family protein [Kitasatospora viridis]